MLSGSNMLRLLLVLVMFFLLVSIFTCSLDFFLFIFIPFLHSISSPSLSALSIISVCRFLLNFLLCFPQLSLNFLCRLSYPFFHPIFLSNFCRHSHSTILVRFLYPILISLFIAILLNYSLISLFSLNFSTYFHFNFAIYILFILSPCLHFNFSLN